MKFDVIVKSDLYQLPGGRIAWSATATEMRARQRRTFVGVACCVDKANEDITFAVEAWLEAPVESRTLVQRVVNDATGHMDNLN